MRKISEITKGFSISFQIFRLKLKEFKYIYEALQKFQFSVEQQKGILNIDKSKKYIEYDYQIVFPKEINIFKNGKEISKKVNFNSISKLIIGLNFLIYIGTTKHLLKTLNDFKNITNSDIKKLRISSSKMEEIYSNFQKVNYLKLYDEYNPFIKNFHIKGDLTEKDKWRDFKTENAKIKEVKGVFNTHHGPINLRLRNDCKLQIYKGKIEINKTLIFWFKDLLIE